VAKTLTIATLSGTHLVSIDRMVDNYDEMHAEKMMVKNENIDISLEIPFLLKIYQ